MLKGTLTAGNLFKIEIIKCAGNVALIYWLKVKSLSGSKRNFLKRSGHYIFKTTRHEINTGGPIQTNGEKAVSKENQNLAGYCILRLSVRTSKWNIKARGT